MTQNFNNVKNLTGGIIAWADEIDNSINIINLLNSFQVILGI